MKFPITLLPIVFSFLVSAQPIIKFDIEGYDYGRIQRGSNGDRKFEFTNTGDSALVVYHARTGDGGSMAEFSRNPILPGEKGEIKFRYDTQRVGSFSRSLCVESNTQIFRMIVKGLVVQPPTMIHISDSIFDVGEINFGESLYRSIRLTNIGTNNLYFSSIGYHIRNPEVDVKIVSIIPLEKDRKYLAIANDYYEPNEVLTLTLEVKNLYGNIGNFHRCIALQTNTNDTVWMTIRGTFVGSPDRAVLMETLYKQVTLYEYCSGKLFLMTKKSTEEEERIFSKQYFENGSTVKVENYNYSTQEPYIKEYFREGNLVCREINDKKNPIER